MSLWTLCRVLNTPALICACHRETEAGWEEEEDYAATIYSFITETIGYYVCFYIMIASAVFYLYMTRTNTISKLMLILDIYFKDCICNCFWLIWNKLKCIPPKLRSINPMIFSAPLDDYYFNNCRIPPNLDNNIPKKAVKCVWISSHPY